MEKTYFIWTVIIALFIVIMSPCQRAAQASLDPVGSIVAIRGTAAAYDAQGAARALTLKSPVYEQDELRTGPRSRLQVLFNDNTIISLGQASTMKISEYAWKPAEKIGAMKATVKEGVFRVMGGAITRQTPRNFNTETPAATIGIRGSMYAGKVSGRQLMVVFEGGKGIDVSNSMGSVSITNPGYGTYVVAEERQPMPPKRFSPDELSELNAQLSTGRAPQEQTTDEAAPTGGEQEAATEGDGGTETASGSSGQEQTQAPSTVSEDQGGDAGLTLDSDELTADASAATAAAPAQDSTGASIITGTVTQDIIEISTTTLQNNLEDQITQTIQTGGTLSGAYLAQRAVDGTTTDFTTWYCNALLASLTGGTLIASGTDQNKTGFSLSFSLGASDTGVGYTPPFDNSGNLITVSQTRSVGFSGVDTSFNSLVASDNLGEFAFFAIQGASFTDNATQYGFRDFGFVGTDTSASQMPANGVSGYAGYALGVDTELISGQTLHLDSTLMNVSMEVNWLSGKAIGRVTDQEGGDIFFFADVSGGALANVKFCGYKDKIDETTPGMIAWVEGTAESARFYGSSCQGFGLSGSGDFYDIATGQSSPVGSGRMVAAAFKEAHDAVDLTSPTGTVTFHGFLTGVSENMTAPSTNRRLFMNYGGGDFMLTIDRQAGSLSGLLCAEDIVTGTSTINDLEIGGSHGSAYVLDDNMAAFIGDTGSDAITTDMYTGGLKTYGNYLITGEIEEQFSDYVTWGYWEISYTDPESGAPYHLHMPGSYWIAGELTPASTMASLASSNFTGVYNGMAKGIRIDSVSTVSELTNGTSQITVNFGTSQVTGNISFDQVTLNLANGSVSASTSGFSAEISGASSSMVNGAFYGPQAQAVGGNFNAAMSGNTYIGIFGGRR